MTRFSVQFLESAYPQATPLAVRERLRQACEILPIESVLLGWDLPPALEEAVAAEASLQGAMLYRWHPLFASDSGAALPDRWQTIGANKRPIPGFRGLPAFTFFCPNNPEAQEWASERIDKAIQRGIYQGLFFDRMRWPSPAENLGEDFGCFCGHCQRLAAERGLDLEAVRRLAGQLLADARGTQRLIRALFQAEDEASLLEQFFRFRSGCISEAVARFAGQAQTGWLSVGLDCFAPSLMRMVGQELRALGQVCDWVKLMTYPHAHGPAGLPFELFNLANWLEKKHGMSRNDGVQFVSQASQVEISCDQGCPAESIRQEIGIGKTKSEAPLFAGLALVQMENTHSVEDAQIRTDLLACKASHPAGLALSWDLWLIPPKRLEMAAKIFA